MKYKHVDYQAEKQLANSIVSQLAQPVVGQCTALRPCPWSWASTLVLVSYVYRTQLLRQVHILECPALIPLGGIGVPFHRDSKAQLLPCGWWLCWTSSPPQYSLPQAQLTNTIYNSTHSTHTHNNVHNEIHKNNLHATLLQYLE